MSDEDGDEEAELARLRAARMGPEAVARLEALRRRAAASTRDGAVFADGATVVEEAPGPAPAPAEAADEADAEALLRASLPSSFGAAAAPPRAASAAAARAPPPAALAAARRASPPRPSPLDDGDDGGGDAGGDDDDGYHLPVTHEALLSGHARLVGALDVDRAGARLASGGSDGVVNIYDFAGMRSNLAPFRTLTPDGGHGARALSWSPTGELLLCVTSSAEPRVLDRDGREQGWFVRGDMYIRDPRHTKGHTQGCSGGAWHPSDRHSVLTCGDDGTLRTWDVSRASSSGGPAGSRCQTAVMRPSPGGGAAARVGATACAWAPDGSLLAGGFSDGSVALWSGRGAGFSPAAAGTVPPPAAQGLAPAGWAHAARPAALARRAHPGSEIGAAGITALRFSADGRLLWSRSASAGGSLRLWDVRALGRGAAQQQQTPLAEARGPLPASSSAAAAAGLALSPDGSLLATACCGDPPDGRGGAAPAAAAVRFFHAATLAPVGRPVAAAAGHALAGPLAWHPRLNQLFLGVGAPASPLSAPPRPASGGVVGLFDPEFSSKGLLLCVGAPQPRRGPGAGSGYVTAATLLGAAAPPVAADGDSERGGGGGGGGGGAFGGMRKRERGAAEKAARERARHAPQGPVGPKGAGGRLGGGTGGTLLTQAFLRARGGLLGPQGEEPDIREAILSHAAAAAAKPQFVDQAYAVTQPVRLYAQPPAPGEDGGEPEEWGA